jgi:hypothetical protein
MYRMKTISTILACLVGCLLVHGHAADVTAAVPPDTADRPNILWITSEDNSPYLGCYGDPLAQTPHLDRLAAGRGSLPERVCQRAGLFVRPHDADHRHVCLFAGRAASPQPRADP